MTRRDNHDDRLALSIPFRAIFTKRTAVHLQLCDHDCLFNCQSRASIEEYRALKLKNYLFWFDVNAKRENFTAILNSGCPFFQHEPFQAFRHHLPEKPPLPSEEPRRVDFDLNSKSRQNCSRPLTSTAKTFTRSTVQMGRCLIFGSFVFKAVESIQIRCGTQLLLAIASLAVPRCTRGCWSTWQNMNALYFA